MRKWLRRRCAGQDCEARRKVGRYCVPCATALDRDLWRG
jgi:hypothetical protein